MAINKLVFILFYSLINVGAHLCQPLVTEYGDGRRRLGGLNQTMTNDDDEDVAWSRI